MNTRWLNGESASILLAQANCSFPPSLACIREAKAVGVALADTRDVAYWGKVREEFAAADKLRLEARAYNASVAKAFSDAAKYHLLLADPPQVHHHFHHTTTINNNFFGPACTGVPGSPLPPPPPGALGIDAGRLMDERFFDNTKWHFGLVETVCIVLIAGFLLVRVYRLVIWLLQSCFAFRWTGANVTAGADSAASPSQTTSPDDSSSSSLHGGMVVQPVPSSVWRDTEVVQPVPRSPPPALSELVRARDLFSTTPSDPLPADDHPPASFSVAAAAVPQWRVSPPLRPVSRAAPVPAPASPELVAWCAPPLLSASPIPSPLPSPVSSPRARSPDSAPPCELSPPRAASPVLGPASPVPASSPLPSSPVASSPVVAPVAAVARVPSPAPASSVPAPARVLAPVPVPAPLLALAVSPALAAEPVAQRALVAPPSVSAFAPVLSPPVPAVAAADPSSPRKIIAPRTRRVAGAAPVIVPVAPAFSVGPDVVDDDADSSSELAQTEEVAAVAVPAPVSAAAPAASASAPAPAPAPAPKQKPKPKHKPSPAGIFGSLLNEAKNPVMLQPGERRDKAGR